MPTDPPNMACRAEKKQSRTDMKFVATPLQASMCLIINITFVCKTGKKRKTAAQPSETAAF